MNSELIMNSDVLDILFEKRNKDYGAYLLRKFYNRRLLASIGIMTAAVLVFSAFTFLPHAAKPGEPIFMETVIATIAPAPKAPKVKPTLMRQAMAAPVSTLKLPSAIIIVDKKDSSDRLLNLKNMDIGGITNIQLNGAVNASMAAGYGAGNGIATEPAKPAEPMADAAKPIDNPEMMPEYPGGMEALRNFLIRNLVNPRDLEEGELISVKIRFVVGYDGKLQRFELIQDGGSEFNNEVIRVLKKMPAWLPGKSKGRNVPVYYVIPVKFAAEG